MALEALKKISEIEHTEAPQTDEPEEIVPRTKYLFFYIGEAKYAVQEKQVQNVLKSLNLYTYPFAPDFIDGVISSRSRIYSVVNFETLCGTSPKLSELMLYVVMKTDQDCYALRASGIEDFFMVPDEAYSPKSHEDDSDFIQGYLSFNEENIPVLDVMQINEHIISSCSREVQ